MKASDQVAVPRERVDIAEGTPAKKVSEALKKEIDTEQPERAPKGETVSAHEDASPVLLALASDSGAPVGGASAGEDATREQSASAPAGNQPIVVREVSSGGGWQALLVPGGVLAVGGIAALLNDDGGGSSGGNSAPVITSNGGKATAAVSVAENRTAVTDVNAIDADGSTLTYSISGGADADKFNISATTGVLTFKAGADFEAKADANGDNVYDVVVKVSDGGHDVTQTLAVTITNMIVEAVADTYSTDEDNTLTVSAADGLLKNDTHDNGDSLTVQVVSGVTKGTLALNPDGSFTYTPNKDYSGTDSFTYKVGDGTNTDTATVTITVTANDNDPPVANDQTFKLAENSAKDSLVGTVAATDPDVGDVRTFAIASGNDDGTFSIDSLTGRLTVANAIALDFETHPQFILVVTVTDKSGLTDSATITIDLTDVAEPSGQASASMADNLMGSSHDPFAGISIDDHSWP